MKKNIFLLMFIGLFIGLCSTYFFYDKIFQKNDTNEYLLDWNLYMDNKDKLNSIITTILVNEEELGIYKNDEVKLKNLKESEKARIVFNYCYEFNFTNDFEYITFDKFNEVSYKLFGKGEYNFDEINLGDGVYLDRNTSKKRYDIKEKNNEEDYHILVHYEDIKGAYQKESLIYFDIPVTFIKYDNNGYSTFSTDILFNNIYCEKDCLDKIKYTTYRIYFNLDENGNYFFEKSVKLGSE